MAIVKHVSEVQSQEMVEGVTARVVIGPEEGAPHFNMRVFDVEPGKATPFHSHWWEHEVYVLSGSGIVRTEAREEKIQPGMAVFMPRDEKHQFVNTGSEPMRFICLVPQEWLENKAEKI